MTEELRPKVGVGVLILKEGKVLLNMRSVGHGAGEYSLAGGHLENLEAFEACARREVLEECGIQIQNVRFLMLYNMVAYAPKHYVTVVMIADWQSGEPVNLEPEKALSWDWFDLDQLPEPLFNGTRVALDCYKSGKWPCFIDSK